VKPQDAAVMAETGSRTGVATRHPVPAKSEILASRLDRAGTFVRNANDVGELAVQAPIIFHMPTSEILTRRLKLLPQTRDDVREAVEQMDDRERAQLSESWLALLDGNEPIDPWVHGFLVRSGATGTTVGKCGFKGPPGADGVVEIAYFIAPEHCGKGYATEAAEALVDCAFAEPRVRTVRAHTLPEDNASGRILTKCGFQRIGEVLDPEDGRVWRWEKERV